MTTLPLALGAWLALAPAEPASPSGKEEVAEAHRHFQRATELYDENNLPGALAEFRRAYAIAPSYKLLYNVGQLCYLLQDFPCAFQSLTRYLDQGGAEVSPQRREEVQRDVSRLQSRVAMLRIRVDKPGAEVTVDNVAVGRTPLTEPVLVAAGRPQIRVTLAGHAPVTRVVEVAGMDTATVDVQLAAGNISLAARAEPAALASARAPAGGETRAGHGSTYAWIATGVLAAGAGTTGALALWSASDLKDHRQRLPAEADDLESRSRRTKRLALATDVLLGGTVVAAAMATVLFLTRPRHPEGIALTVSPGGIGLRGSF